MIIVNNSLLSSSTTTTATTTFITSYLNSTMNTDDIPSSSFGIILTIIILSLLSISGWIFMSYTLFGRSEAYRTKPDDPLNPANNSDRPNDHNEFFLTFD
ncbi:unnamed protein product [Adineta steineri]|uniref:Uncharacterized protein n=1 Tax=Adineta steineri TaxID=433720 RepID=A0A814DZP7_9BILA|nr:unnamed protein product [Adineta steineri]